jgi:hypothetical protein
LNSSLNFQGILKPSEREMRERVLNSYSTLCTVRTIHCDQRCGNSLGLHIFKTNFEIPLIGISKNQNGGKSHNALRTMTLLSKFKTNTCR